MLIILLGSIVAFTIVSEIGLVPDRKPGDTVVRLDVGESYQLDQVFNVEPAVVQKNRNVVRQQYDYSCGSAALTTLLDFYLGRNFQERQVMEGLLRFGETERIIQRRGFSLLDMKRLVTALGHPSGGFKAQAKDLLELDHPAIAPIEYAGFKHFVVIRAVKDNRVYVADPALGNITFTLHRFLEVWDNNVLFIVFPNGHKPATGLELREEDMRFVSDYLIAENSFKEFPHWQIRYEHDVSNKIAALHDNTNGSFQNKLDSSGNPIPIRDTDGNVVLNNRGKPKYQQEFKISSSGDPKEYNMWVVPEGEIITKENQQLEKTLRYKRK